MGHITLPIFHRILSDTPVGPLVLETDDHALIRLQFLTSHAEDEKKTLHVTANHPILDQTEQQLREYFNRSRQVFTVPLAPPGTEFQRQVWQMLCSIPYGATATYGDIAAQIGNPNAARAVGMANHRNPIAIIVPCHRVIGTNGKLVGYAGGLAAKQQLIDLETR